MVKAVRQLIFTVAVLAAMAALSGVSFAYPLENRDIIVVASSKSGDRELLVADSSDTVAVNVFQYAANSPEFKKIIDAHKKSERIRLVAAGEKNLDVKIKPLVIDISDDGYFGACDVYSFTVVRRGADGKTREEEFKSYPKSRISRETAAKFNAGGHDEDYAKEVLFHETAHGILWEAYGETDWPKWNTFVQVHTPGMVVDEGWALNEGWAIGNERHFRDKPYLAVRAENYEYRNGKSEADLHKTEGAVGDFIFCLLRSGRIDDAFDKALNVLSSRRPNSIEAFIQNFKKMYPGDAAEIDEIIKDTLVPPLLAAASADPAAGGASSTGEVSAAAVTAGPEGEAATEQATGGAARADAGAAGRRRPGAAEMGAKAREIMVLKQASDGAYKEFVELMSKNDEPDKQRAAERYRVANKRYEDALKAAGN